MGFKGNALNLSCLIRGELCSPLKFLLVATLVNNGGQSPPFRSKECLKPAKGSAFGNCKLLKKLGQNF